MITNRSFLFRPPIPAQNNRDLAKDPRIPENGHNDFPVCFFFFDARTVTSTDDALMMCEAR